MAFCPTQAASVAHIGASGTKKKKKKSSSKTSTSTRDERRKSSGSMLERMFTTKKTSQPARSSGACTTETDESQDMSINKGSELPKTFDIDTIAKDNSGLDAENDEDISSNFEASLLLGHNERSSLAAEHSEITTFSPMMVEKVSQLQTQVTASHTSLSKEATKRLSYQPYVTDEEDDKTTDLEVELECARTRGSPTKRKGIPRSRRIANLLDALSPVETCETTNHTFNTDFLSTSCIDALDMASQEQAYNGARVMEVRPDRLTNSFTDYSLASTDRDDERIGKKTVTRPTINEQEKYRSKGGCDRDGTLNRLNFHLPAANISTSYEQRSRDQNRQVNDVHTNDYRTSVKSRAASIDHEVAHRNSRTSTDRGSMKNNSSTEWDNEIERRVNSENRSARTDTTSSRNNASMNKFCEVGVHGTPTAHPNVRIFDTAEDDSDDESMYESSDYKEPSPKKITATPKQTAEGALDTAKFKTRDRVANVPMATPSPHIKRSDNNLLKAYVQETNEPGNFKTQQRAATYSHPEATIDHLHNQMAVMEKRIQTLTADRNASQDRCLQLELELGDRYPDNPLYKELIAFRDVFALMDGANETQAAYQENQESKRSASLQTLVNSPCNDSALGMKFAPIMEESPSLRRSSDRVSAVHGAKKLEPFDHAPFPIPKSARPYVDAERQRLDY